MTDTAAETRSPHFGREATASTYRDIHLPRIFAPWARVLLEIVPVHPGEAVLDVATGPGTVAREAALQAGPSGRVTGVDISQAMLNIGRAWALAPGAAPIEYLEASASALPVPDGAFDVAYCQQGLQHMADPQAALREMRRALKPGGRIGLAVWVKSPFGQFRDVAASVGLRSSGPQPSEFGRTADDLAAALRELGFSDIQVETREQTAVLEGGIPQALEVARATSLNVALADGAAEHTAAFEAAVSRVLEPLVRADGVHLRSITNIAVAHR